MDMMKNYYKGTIAAGKVQEPLRLSWTAVYIHQRHKGMAHPKEPGMHVMALWVGVFAALSMICIGTAQAQQGERPDFGGGGVFSYVPPQGWKVAEFPGLKFKISLGAPVKGFSPNIVVVDEAYEKSLDDYAKDNIATMQQMFPGMKLLGQSDFTTSDGARAIKLVTERHDESVKGKMRQVYYLYDAGDKKLAVTCSSLADDAAASDATCDGAMKTFTVKPGTH